MLRFMGIQNRVLQSFALESQGFTLEAELWIETVKRGLQVRQIPIGYKARLDGSHAKLQVWDGLRIGWFLIRKRGGRSYD